MERLFLWVRIAGLLLLVNELVGCAQSQVLERRAFGDMAAVDKCHVKEGQISLARTAGFECRVGKFNRGLVMQPTLSQDDMEKGGQECSAVETKYAASVVPKLKKRLNFKSIADADACKLVLTPDEVAATNGRRSITVDVALVSLQTGEKKRSAKIEAIASPFSSNESLVGALVDGIVAEQRMGFGAHGLVESKMVSQRQDVGSEFKNAVNMDFDVPSGWDIATLPDDSVTISSRKEPSCSGRLFRMPGRDGQSPKAAINVLVDRIRLYPSHELVRQVSSVSFFNVPYELAESKVTSINKDEAVFHAVFTPYENRSVYMELWSPYQQKSTCDDVIHALIASVRRK